MIGLRRLFHVSFAALALATPALAEPSKGQTNTAKQLISDYRLLGEVSFKKFIFHIYDAELRVEGSSFSWEQPYALILTYARKISREELVEASLAEMARIGEKDVADFESFRAPLSACFADVREGDKITGHSLNADKAVFYLNGDKTCVLEASGASKTFFSIWLGDNTMDPDRSRKLLGFSS